MRKFILIIATAVFCTSLNAQYGLSLKYQAVNSTYWEELFTDADGEYATQLLGASVFYWFRLKEKRVEFLPEFGYHRSIGKSSKSLSSNQQRVSFLFNIDVYLFDIINDCDCPTFSKQGTAFQRSFFIELSPGVDFQILSLDDVSGQNRTYDASELTFRIGIGAGFDFGISDFLTVTPLISINYGSRPKWQGLVEVLDTSTPVPDNKSEWIVSAGIRATFRPDYKRRYR
jgi:hypothetical protein